VVSENSYSYSGTFLLYTCIHSPSSQPWRAIHKQQPLYSAQDSCASFAECQFYSFDSVDSICFFFSDCPIQSEDICSGCVSGQPECGQDDVPGLVDDNCLYIRLLLRDNCPFANCLEIKMRRTIIAQKDNCPERQLPRDRSSVQNYNITDNHFADTCHWNTLQSKVLSSFKYVTQYISKLLNFKYLICH
jgi:hypothetical protein